MQRQPAQPKLLNINANQVPESLIYVWTVFFFYYLNRLHPKGIL